MVLMEIQKILGYKITRNFNTLYLGNNTQSVLKEDMYLVNILCVACKKSITRNWYKSDTPSLGEWMEIVKEIYNMEEMTLILRLKKDLFLKYWKKWIEYCNVNNQ